MRCAAKARLVVKRALLRAPSTTVRRAFVLLTYRRTPDRTKRGDCAGA